VQVPKYSPSNNSITWFFFGEPPHFQGQRYGALTGKVLYCDTHNVDFPPFLNTDHIETLADRAIRKTLIHATLSNPLLPGERGWLRVVANPRELDAIPAREILPKNTSFPSQYEQRSAVSSSLIVRDALLTKMEEYKEVAKAPKVVADCETIRDLVYHQGISKKGTTIRIADHRLAMIAEDGIEICNLIPTGHITFLCRVPHLERRDGCTALLWGGGSSRNHEYDILYNAQRIIDMIYHTPPKSSFDIAVALAPSGKHEAFSKLIEMMKKAGILVPTIEETLNLNEAVRESKDKHEDFTCSPFATRLRNMYSLPSMEEQLSLLSEFSDLHPFQIEFTLKWFA